MAQVLDFGSVIGPRGPQGPQGEPGHTPVKGVDYWTKQEQAALDAYLNGTYQGTDLTVKFAEEIAGYESPWAWIRARIRAADFSGLLICDYIPFTTTNGRTFQAQIAGINTYKGYGENEVDNHIDFITRELWPELFAMNRVNINNGTSADKRNIWIASNGYLFVNSLSGQVPNSTAQPYEMVDVDYTAGGMYFYLPDELKAVIVEKLAFAPTRFSESGVLKNDNGNAWFNMGKLWLPDMYEITGSNPIGSTGTFNRGYVQYPIFAHSMNRTKRVQNDGNRFYWWTSSANNDDFSSSLVINRSGVLGVNVTSNVIRAPLCFRIS